MTKPSANICAGLREMTLVLLVLLNYAAEAARRDPFWMNPCMAIGRRRHHSDFSNIPVHGHLHRPSPKPLRRLRTQMTSTWSHLNQLSPFLAKRICTSVSGFGTEINYDWLPPNPTQWYRKQVKCLDKKNKVLILLPKFQEGLQRFAASLNQMRTTRSSPTVTYACRTSRQKTLDDIAARLNQLLCEVDMTIYDMKIRPGRALTDAESRRFMPDYGRHITTGQLYDWGVLSTYMSFMKDWQRIIKQVVGPKGDAKCTKPHRNKVQVTLM